MADKGISVISHNGEDYNINDPNIAGEFYPNSNYAVGDHVTHEGKLYVFTAAHTGAWTGTDVTQVQIGAELHDYGAHAMVRYDVAQTLTDAQKAVARSNIAAANAELEDKIGTVPSGTTVENQIFAQGTQISTNASNIDALQRQVGTVPTDETVEGQITDLKSAISVLEPVATAEDVGKTLVVKTVESGRATAYEFGETSEIDDTAGEGDTDKTWSANKLTNVISTIPSIPQAVKIAMDNLFAKSAYAEDDVAGDYAVFHRWATSVAVLEINASFSQGDYIIYETDTLESLKTYLVVTALYSDGTSAVIENYTLSGTLSEGVSTVTVNYEDKYTTFNVTVTASIDWDISWDYTDGNLPNIVAPNDWLVVSDEEHIGFEAGKGIKYDIVWSGYNIRAKEHQYTEIGAIEIVVNFPNLPTCHDVRATLGTSNNCIIAFIGRKGVYINSSSATPIPGVSISANVDHTLLVQRNASLGSVYLDRRLVYSGELRNIQQDNNMLIGLVSNYSTAIADLIYVKSIKFYHES